MPFDPNLYHEKYRIPSSRADWWEYCEGIYFITIVVKNRQHAFGEINRNPKTGDNQMHLSKLGQFVDNEIPKIMDHYPYAYIPTWVVMPDHIHMIIMIDVRGRTWDYSNDGLSNDNGLTDNGLIDNGLIDNGLIDNGLIDNGLIDNDLIDNGRDVPRNVSTINAGNTGNDVNTGNTGNTGNDVNTNNPKSSFMSSISPKTGSLPLVIRQFKQAITIYARQNHIPFAWQPRYHDSMIKNQIGFDRVCKYIENNIDNWGKK